VTNTDWMHDGKCLDHDPELFYEPLPTGSRSATYVHPAVRICRRCPVEATCLKYALDTRQNFGVWGGTTEDERKAMLAGAVRPWMERPDADPDVVRWALARARSAAPDHPDMIAQGDRVREMSAQGATIGEIGNVLHMSHQTVNRLLHHDPAPVAQVRSRTQERRQEARDLKAQGTRWRRSPTGSTARGRRCGSI
jgi:WhiB family redox-sensing transcriptional regulator